MLADHTGNHAASLEFQARLFLKGTVMTKTDENQTVFLDEEALPGAYSDFPAVADATWYRPIRGGSMISYHDAAGGHAGAFGALVRREVVADMYFLTAAHVVKAVGGLVYQPRVQNTRNQIGVVESLNTTLDVAVVKVCDGIEHCNWVIGIGPITGSHTILQTELPYFVQMRGPVTGYQYGYVERIDNGTLYMDIHGDSGDSGSAIVDDQGRLVGIFTGSSPAGFTGCSIEIILSTFDVDVVIDSMPSLIAVRETSGDKGWQKYSTLTGREWTSSSDQLFPTTQQNFRSSGPPAMAAFSSRSELLYSVFENPGNNGKILSATLDGTALPSMSGWSNERFFPYPGQGGIYGTTGTPSIATFRGRLMIMMQNSGDSGSLGLSSFDGNFWNLSNPNLPTESSPIGTPAILSFKNELHCIRVYSSNSYGLDALWWASWDGNRWNDQPMLALGDDAEDICKSSSAVALAIYRDNLYCMWEGTDKNEGWLEGATYDGIRGIWNRLPLGKTFGISGAPALVNYNDRLYCIREGQGDSGWLWSARFNGDTWTDKLIPSSENAYDTTGRPALAIFPKRTTAQKNWFNCTQCHGLFLVTAGFNGICPKDQRPHAPFNLTIKRFCLPFNSDTIGEKNWAKCLNCHGLFYKGSENGGVCPATLGTSGHTAGSGNYTLVFNKPGFPGESGWMKCSKCGGLYRGAGGICPAGADHQQQGTNNYSLIYEAR